MLTGSHAGLYVISPAIGPYRLTPSSTLQVLDSKVYDVTSFLSSHPGGAAIILRQAGTVGF